jgi:hypothetical protein
VNGRTSWVTGHAKKALTFFEELMEVVEASKVKTEGEVVGVIKGFPPFGLRIN